VAFYNFLTNGQANASSWIIGAAVQSLEQREDTLQVLRLDADAIVVHGEGPRALLPCGRDMHVRGLMRPLELNAMSDQVLEELAELNRIGTSID
jgi:hypothetical protein